MIPKPWIEVSRPFAGRLHCGGIGEFFRDADQGVSRPIAGRLHCDIVQLRVHTISRSPSYLPDVVDESRVPVPPYGNASLDLGGAGRGLEVPWRRDRNGGRLGAVGDVAEFRRPVATAPTASSGGPSIPAGTRSGTPLSRSVRARRWKRLTMILQISHQARINHEKYGPIKLGDE
jgi:hypothetical protein